MLRWLVPHHQIGTVVELTPERLRRWQLEALLLDVDCTLKRYRAPGVSPEVGAWLQSLHEAGFGLCLVSNGRTRRIGELAETLRLPYVAKALKPLPFGLRRAVQKLGFPAAHTAMVGDQLFADVLAAHWAGLISILVRPMHPEEEPWFTRIKRPLERIFLPLATPPPGEAGPVGRESPT